MLTGPVIMQKLNTTTENFFFLFFWFSSIFLKLWHNCFKQKKIVDTSNRHYKWTSWNKFVNCLFYLISSFVTQVWNAAQITGDVILLFLRFFYYILETVFRYFVPIPPKSVKGEIVLVKKALHSVLAVLNETVFR